MVVVCADEGEVRANGRRTWPLSPGRRWSPCPPGSLPSTTPPWCPGSMSTGGFPSLRALAAGECPLLVCTVEAILQRTMPQDPADPGGPGGADGGEPRSATSSPRPWSPPGYTRCEQVEGVGQFALRGRHSGLFLPRPPEARSGWSSSGTRSTPWASSTRTPSGGSKTSARRRFCPPPRCCPSLRPAATAACWSCWTVSFPG